VTVIAFWKHIEKMAQFDLFGSRQGMFMGSFSMVVGVVTLVV